MPPIIGKPVGKVAQEVAALESGQIFQSPLNKIWRALILINRATSPMAKAEPRNLGKVHDAKNLHYAKKGSFSLAQAQDPWTQNKVQAGLSNGAFSAEEMVELQAMDYTAMNKELFEAIKNEIVIANLGASPAVSLVIQNRPNELKVDPTSTWAAVKSMGRNNPFYFYTGGEDTISFEISWYTMDPTNRDDVVNKCRLLESWTRANGYSAGPPVLKIQWGGSGLFEDDLFILTAAPYTLTHFQNSARTGRYKHNEFGQRVVDSGMQVVDLKLLPNYATQTLTFKRVSTSNRTWEDIIPSSKLQRTPGINYTAADSDPLENASGEE